MFRPFFPRGDGGIGAHSQKTAREDMHRKFGGKDAFNKNLEKYSTGPVSLWSAGGRCGLPMYGVLPVVGAVPHVSNVVKAGFHRGCVRFGVGSVGVRSLRRCTARLYCSVCVRLCFDRPSVLFE